MFSSQTSKPAARKQQGHAQHAARSGGESNGVARANSSPPLYTADRPVLSLLAEPGASAAAQAPPEVPVSQPDDPSEQEAERNAERMTRMPEPAAQRACDCGGGCPKCQGAQGTLRSRGQPLDDATRGFMEPLFGQDFGDVRVHTDARAAESAEQVDSLAYTLGRDVVFGRGQYAPATEEGKRLLAHELTHVVQQGSAPPGQPAVIQRTPRSRRSSRRGERTPSPPSESPGARWFRTHLARDAQSRQLLTNSLRTAVDELSPNGPYPEWIEVRVPEPTDEVISVQPSELRDLLCYADSSACPERPGGGAHAEFIPNQVRANLQFDARLTPTSAVLRYGNRRVIINDLNTAHTGSPAFAYQYLPPVVGNSPEANRPAGALRDYPIIRVVAAPGVQVAFEGFPTGTNFADQTTPLVEVYRVQDTRRVPAQGEPIHPDDYTGMMTAREADADANAATPADRGPNNILVNRRPDGVDIVTAATLGQEGVRPRGLRVTAPNLSATARFAYEVTFANALGVSRNSPPRVRLIVTPSVRVTLVGVWHGEVFTDFMFEVYQVQEPSQVPQQGSRLSPTGALQTNIPAETELTPEQQLLQLAVGAMPIIGELAAVAEFAYGVRTGRSFWGGHPLQQDELELLGLTAAFSVISIGAEAVSGARALARMTSRGTRTEGLEGLARGIANLHEAERASVERLAARVRRGEALTPDEEARARGMLRQLRDESREPSPTPSAAETERAGAARVTGDAPRGGSGAAPNVGRPRDALEGLGAEQRQAFIRWEETLNAETQNAMAANPSLRRFYAEMDSSVRRLLTQCGSPCIPTFPPPSPVEVARVRALLDRLGLGTSGNHEGLRQYLHLRRNDLTTALDAIGADGLGDVASLEARLAQARRANVLTMLGEPRRYQRLLRLSGNDENVLERLLDLTDSVEELENLFERVADPETLELYLRMAGRQLGERGGGEGQRLSAVIERAGRDLRRVNVFLNRAADVAGAQTELGRVAANSDNFRVMTDALPNFPSQFREPNVLLEMPRNLWPPGEQELRILPETWDHYLEEHTFEYFNFSRVGPFHGIWPLGTPASEIRDALEQTLDILRAGGDISGEGPFVRIGNQYQQRTVRLPSGIWVQIGVRPDWGSPTALVIGQFFPLRGEGVSYLTRDQLQAIQTVLGPARAAR